MSEITLCVLTSDEQLNWVNERYQEVNFSLSKRDSETIILAYCLGQPVGVGRLIDWGSKDFELSGIYVSEDYRGKGIAGKIVTELLKYTSEAKRVYCLPFSNLNGFYQRFGFCKTQNAPPLILEKYRWVCTVQKNPVSMLLLELDAS